MTCIKQVLNNKTLWHELIYVCKTAVIIIIMQVQKYKLILNFEKLKYCLQFHQLSCAAMPNGELNYILTLMCDIPVVRVTN